MATLDLSKIGKTTDVANFLPTIPKAITSTNTKPTAQVNLTPKPDNTNYAGILASAQQQALAIQQQIAGLTQQSQQQGDANYTNPNANYFGQQTQTQSQTPSIMDYIKSIEAPPSATETYSQLQSQSGLDEQKAQLAEKAKVTTEAQARLGNISAQIQALNAEATAVPIQLQQDSEGRGRTAGGIAPLQADELRKIALRAIPLQIQAYTAQAEVANAQGQQQLAQDLYTQAENTLNRQFELQMQDANRQYEYKTNLISQVYEFADRQEQRQLQAVRDQAERDFTLQRDELNYQRDLQMQSIKNASSGSTGGGVLSSLPVSIQGKVISASEGFGTSDIVKKFNSVVDSINVVNGISSDSTNPADHQAIVYAFAKALDPESVVREGEYETIKKYAQSAAQRYGKEISNALEGTGFLSQAAIKNIQTTMNNLYTSRKPQYESAYAERARTINNIAGADVAGEILRDYSQGASVPEVNQEEEIYNSVVTGGDSSSWITNLWNKLF